MKLRLYFRAEGLWGSRGCWETLTGRHCSRDRRSPDSFSTLSEWTYAPFRATFLKFKKEKSAHSFFEFSIQQAWKIISTINDRYDRAVSKINNFFSLSLSLPIFQFVSPIIERVERILYSLLILLILINEQLFHECSGSFSVGGGRKGARESRCTSGITSRWTPLQDQRWTPADSWYHANCPVIVTSHTRTFVRGRLPPC